jgi:hypothetical protein
MRGVVLVGPLIILNFFRFKTSRLEIGRNGTRVEALPVLKF